MFFAYCILFVVSVIVSIVFPCSMGIVLATSEYDEFVLGIKILLISMPFIIAGWISAGACLKKIRKLSCLVNFANIYDVTFAKYDVDCRLIKRKRVKMSDDEYPDGHFYLKYPSWKFPEQGKDTADPNKLRNPILWGDSSLVLDEYVLKSKRPDAILFIAQQLRKNGIAVAPCTEEIEKKEQLIKKAQLASKNEKLDEVIRFCGNDEDKFIELCDVLLKQLGYITAKVTKEDRDGYDIVIEKGDQLTVVACACHVRGYKEDKKALNRLMRANQETVPCNMMFMTTGDFNPEAIALANREHIVLINGYALLNLFIKNGLMKQPNVKEPSEEESRLLPEDLLKHFPADISPDLA